MHMRGRAIKFIILLLGAFVMLYPVLWMVSSSFKPNAMIFTEVSLWPSKITFENYMEGWRGFAGITFDVFFGNSFVIVFFAILGNVVTCSMAAYAFAVLTLR